MMAEHTTSDVMFINFFIIFVVKMKKNVIEDLN